MLETLTGNIRTQVKTRCFRKPLLILQVQVRQQGEHYCPYGGHGSQYDNVGWRDAKAEDLTNELLHIRFGNTKSCII